MIWHILTGEYPPVLGGVSGYTQLVAEQLAGAGDEVHVWCPPLPGSVESNGVRVHATLGRVSRADLAAVGRQLDRFPAPRRLLVQWVPHGFGYRSLNVGFCLWLRRRARRGDRVEIMVHEPYIAFGEGGLRWTAAASVHRVMTTILARTASRIWIAIPDWERRWRPWAFGRDVPFGWLPIPNTLPEPDSAAVHATRERLAPAGELIVGHFGSHGRTIPPALSASLPAILDRAPRSILLLLGQHGQAFRRALIDRDPRLTRRVHAPGVLSPGELAPYVSACDVLVQPYPDGISSRRTSAMAGLAAGVPVVSTSGHLTEPFWSETRCVSLVTTNAPEALTIETLKLLADDRARRRLAARGQALYRRQFDVRHTIHALRGDAGVPCAS